MIPPSWTPVTRPTDGERVGFLAPDGAGAIVPTSLIGHPLAAARDWADAVTLLVEQGLRRLDGRWWCRLPGRLPVGVLAAGEPELDWEWRAVVLVEVSPEGCTVRLEMAEPAELRGRASLPVPVGDLLCEEPPEG